MNMVKKNYIYELMIKNESFQEERVKIITTLKEELLRSIINYDVEVISCKEYPNKIVL